MLEPGPFGIHDSGMTPGSSASLGPVMGYRTMSWQITVSGVSMPI